jgi:hypothetical protein
MSALACSIFCCHCKDQVAACQGLSCLSARILLRLRIIAATPSMPVLALWTSGKRRPSTLLSQSKSKGVDETGNSCTQPLQLLR